MKLMKVITIRKKIPTTMNRSKRREIFRICATGMSPSGNTDAIASARNKSVQMMNPGMSKYFLR